MHSSTPRKPLRLLLSAVVALGVAAAVAPTAQAARNDDTALAKSLIKRTSGKDANRHLIALQRIAEQNSGNRASATSGYDASVEYVSRKLTEAGFAVSTPTYTYDEDVVDAASLSVAGTTVAFNRMTFSGSTPAGGVKAPLAVVPVDADPGCQASDYAKVKAKGAVVLVQRGACPFAEKVKIAAEQGALGVLVYNNTDGELRGTLSSRGALPVVGLTKADGEKLATQNAAQVAFELRSHVVVRTSKNVIAETKTGKRDNVVMAGAHLDSVTDGPGMDDNGSGSAGLLDVALKLGSSPKVNNTVRFAWWGSEELGLIGSTNWVRQQSSEQLLDVALYLNFDMIASPNAGYFVYDGDDSDKAGQGPGPYGSAQIEKVFTDFFANTLKVPSRGTDFSGRSDYGPFIAAGIPSGGLFTGAEGKKTEDEAKLWGGSAGVAYDGCYHQKCDNLGNLDRRALDRNVDAAAWAVAVFAVSTNDVNGVQRMATRHARALPEQKMMAVDHFAESVGQ